MEALGAGGAPLYGRLDWMGLLRPFDYLDAARMVRGYGSLDAVRVYAAFGGVPESPMLFASGSRRASALRSTPSRIASPAPCAP